MPPAPGQMLSHYRLVEQIGRGGMGEVWRAVDTSLDRDVAVKILPEAFACDPSRLERFEREAKAVAALADPNILAIHGFGREVGLVYAVMELLEGETLRERLAGGPLPARKVVEVGRQIARGLAAAHEKGFVHRDLKPENLFMTRSGRVKILDFGLAGLTGAATEAAEEPTRTALTSPGTVLGTVGYMSPEQVRGLPLDHRSDVFSLGVVLYEALTGAPPFRRDTSAETMTAILREDPVHVATAAHAVPPALERVVQRCLEKQPEERFQSARDLAFALENALGTSSASESAMAAHRIEARRSVRPRWWVTVVVGLVGATGGLVLGPRLVSSQRTEPVRVHTITFSGSDVDASCSPDGRMIAFASQRDGRSRIWIKQVAGGGEQPLSEGNDSYPRFSPDGSSVLFLRAEGDRLAIHRQALVGGQTRRLVDDAVDAAWSPDGSRVAFLRVVPAASGERRATVVGAASAQDGTGERVLGESDNFFYGLSWSPDGKKIAVMETSVTGNSPNYNLVLVPADGGELERIAPSATGTQISPPQWLGDGKAMLFARAGSLLGDQGSTLGRVVRFDLATRREETLFFAEHLFPNIGNRSVGSGLDILGPGTLVFSAAPVRENLREFVLGGDAAARPLRVLTGGEGRDRQPVYSPDGEHLLFTSNRSGNLDLWTMDLDTGALRQLTDDAAQDWDPAFTANGQQIVWSSNRSGNLEVWMASADGSGARQVTQDGVDAENPSPTRDGRWIVYWSSNPEKPGIWMIHPDGSDATHLVKGPYLQCEVSPDGRYAAFLSIEAHNLRNVVRVVDVETGQVPPFEIVIHIPYNNADDVILGRTRWLPDGSGIAFASLDEQRRTGIHVQAFDPNRETSATRRPIAGFTADFITESFAISPDGQRITLAGIHMTQRVMIAEGVPGVEPRRRLSR